MKTVAILSINHRHGTNVSAHVDEEDARRAVVEFVQENWYSTILFEDMGDRDEAIATYFDDHPKHESFEVTIADVEGLREPERWVIYDPDTDWIIGNPRVSQEEAIAIASEMDGVLVLPLRTGVS